MTTDSDKRRILTKIKAIAFNVLVSDEIMTKQTALSEMIERIESAFFPVEPAETKSVDGSCGAPPSIGMDMRKELCRNNIAPTSVMDLLRKLEGKDEVNGGGGGSKFKDGETFPEMMKQLIADLEGSGVNVRVHVFDLSGSDKRD